MDRKVSPLKISILAASIVWCASIIFGLAITFEIEGIAFYALTAICTAVLSVLLYARYRPLLRHAGVYSTHLMLGSRIVYHYEVIEAYEIGLSGKVLFTLINPRFDYTTSFFKAALVVRTLDSSFLIDSAKVQYLGCPLIKHRKNTASEGLIYWLALSAPIVLSFLSRYLSFDPLWYICPMIIIIFLITRLVPPFYLSTKLKVESLPLNSNEASEFKNLTIIKGFVLTNRLSVLPFRKPSQLDGLAMNLLLKRFIILNPRLFSLGCDDYLRFVLFHELCHIKHNDGLGAVMVPAAVIIIDIIVSILPQSIINYIPYYEYLLIGTAIIYLAYTIVTRKNIEKRADRYGMDRIGQESVSNIKITLGFDLNMKS